MNFLSPTGLLAVAALMLMAQSESHGSVVNDGTTRAQQTAFDPAFEGFYASATTFGLGEPGPFNASVTHLWGRYYAVAAHEVTGIQSLGQIYLGSDYVNNPGPPIAISSVDISPVSDLAIITASTADNSPRDPTSKLVGIAVARQSGSQDVNGGTIINYFATAQNLQFINQITGTNITMNDILSGNTIFAAPQVGMVVRGKGFGVWGNFSGSLNNPDGKAGEWWTTVDANAPTFSGDYNYVNTNLYVLTKRTLDPLGGLGASFDSGCPVITIVPPPTLLMQRVGTNVVLTWSGTFTLQTATNLATGFTDVPGAASPYTNSVIADPQRFFRLRLP